MWLFLEETWLTLAPNPSRVKRGKWMRLLCFYGKLGIARVISAHLEAPRRMLLFRLQSLSVPDAQCPHLLTEHVTITTLKIIPLENVLLIYFFFPVWLSFGDNKHFLNHETSKSLCFEKSELLCCFSKASLPSTEPSEMRWEGLGPSASGQGPCHQQLSETTSAAVWGNKKAKHALPFLFCL